MSSMSGKFRSFRAVLFFKTAGSHSKQNLVNRVDVLFHKSIFGSETALQGTPSNLDHCHGGESNSWTNVMGLLTVSI